MDSPSSSEQVPAPLQLEPVIADKSILKKLKLPLPKYHVDDLTAPASIVAMFKARRSGLISPIVRQLKIKHEDFTGVLSGKRLKIREAHLRSQLQHAPHELDQEQYAQAIAALQKALGNPDSITPRNQKPFKASLERVLARERRSSRFSQARLETPGSSTFSDPRKRSNAVATAANESPRTAKRSKTIARNAMEELEIELFGSLDTDSSDKGEDEDEGERDNKPIVEPIVEHQPRPLIWLPPITYGNISALLD
ncbi:hypothetical protein BGX38DRAFT_1192292 [Terfezia claveryi]|nr:hypothetical protein BGX38DRAFT_1192292 [Terfezia claveryi]